MNYRTYLQLVLLLITLSFISCGDCNDNIKNGNETAIDCGGRCDSCPSCSDSIKNGDEIGIDCGGTCVPCDINVSKELVIIDLNVVNSAEAINGRLSFNHLMTTLAGSEDPGKLVLSLLDQWETDFVFSENSTAVARLEGITAFKDKWIRADGFEGDAKDWIPNLENSPFRLLAITNRLDLHSLDLGSGGEGRFTFGALDPITRAPLTWLFIFEYNLNASSPSDCTNWANTWHSLGNPSLTDSMYLERLVAVTDSFVMMRNLNQLRTNDFHLRRLWELREFGHDLSSNTFIAQPLALTPDLSFNGSEELGQFVEDNVAGIDSCNYEYPDSMKAASTADNNARFTWNNQGSAPDKTKKKASLFTCNGCHNGDKLQIVDTVTPNFLHIPPRDSLNESQVSEFLKTMARLDRREVFLKALQVDSNTIDSIMKMPLTSAEISDRKVFIERLPENFIH